jgi:hypothetical protein
MEAAHEPEIEELVPRPVDSARLAAWFRSSGQRFFVGEDGTIAGIWNACHFTFALVGRGQVLQVRGQWNRVAAIERREELARFIDARHARTSWPTCALSVLDDGSIRVTAVHSVLVSRGLSDPQLERALRVGLSSGLAVFAELTRRYPDPVSAPPEGLA